MFRLTGKYLAKADDGRVFEVREHQEFIDAGTMKDPHAVAPGLKELSLSDGSRVNYVDENTFEIVATGTILKRVR